MPSFLSFIKDVTTYFAVTVINYGSITQHIEDLASINNYITFMIFFLLG